MFINEKNSDFKEADLSPGTLEIAERAVYLCGFGKDELILDAGCGFGKTSSYLNGRSGIKTISLDISFDNLKLTGLRCDETNCVCSDLNCLPFMENAFDGIFCQCVLSLMEEKDKVLKMLKGILKKEGKIVISDIYLREQSGKDSKGKREIKSCLDGAVTEKDLKELIKNSGFSIEFIEEKTHLLKQMAGQIIFDYGSLTEYRKSISGIKIFSDCLLDNLSNYGYILIIAGKK